MCVGGNVSIDVLERERRWEVRDLRVVEGANAKVDELSGDMVS